VFLQLHQRLTGLERATLYYAPLWLLGLVVWSNALTTEWGFAVAGLLLVPAAVFAGLWVREMRLATTPRLRWSGAATRLYVGLWPAILWCSDALELTGLSETIRQLAPWGLFCIGLAWTIWYLERASRRIELQRINEHLAHGDIVHAATDEESLAPMPGTRSWNPFDPFAWYYGRASRKLKQSTFVTLAYSAGFWLAWGLLLLALQFGGCQESADMPAGGGQYKQVAQTVKIQKVIRKKFVINPFSAIKFDVPPIDDVKLQLQEVTEHAYTVGYGEGTGAGFGGGKKGGKIRFIRLQYDGGDWDQEFGIGGDENMLLQFDLLTNRQHQINDKTEFRSIDQLANFAPEATPPFVYMTGQGNISLSNKDVKTLREYLIDRHGMIFADNGGSRHFHNQFVSAMNRVLPDIRPVPVPLDDTIHRVPYPLPFLPYVAPHGGKQALGWSLDGRWLVYYHPGDIGDAWADGHSGVSPEVYEACYQLGTNVITYAYVERSKWLLSKQKGK
jgi:hypothetical protein